MEECLDQKDLLNDQYLGPPPLYLHASINHPKLKTVSMHAKGMIKKAFNTSVGSHSPGTFSKNKREIYVEAGLKAKWKSWRICGDISN